MSKNRANWQGWLFSACCPVLRAKKPIQGRVADSKTGCDVRILYSGFAQLTSGDAPQGV